MKLLDEIIPKFHDYIDTEVKEWNEEREKKDE